MLCLSAADGNLSELTCTRVLFYSLLIIACNTSFIWELCTAEKGEGTQWSSNAKSELLHLW